MIIKTLRLQNQWAHRHERKVKPEDMRERIERQNIQSEKTGEGVIVAHGIREPEAHGKKAGVHQLVDLCPDMTVALQHGIQSGGLEFSSARGTR
jgi:hypothetical protein